MRKLNGIFLEKVGCRIEKDKVKWCSDCELNKEDETDCYEFLFENEIESLFQHTGLKIFGESKTLE